MRDLFQCSAWGRGTRSWGCSAEPPPQQRHRSLWNESRAVKIKKSRVWRPVTDTRTPRFPELLRKSLIPQHEAALPFCFVLGFVCGFLQENTDLTAWGCFFRDRNWKWEFSPPLHTHRITHSDLICCMQQHCSKTISCISKHSSSLEKINDSVNGSCSWMRLCR